MHSQLLNVPNCNITFDFRLFSSAGPQPTSGGAGTSGRHHPQIDGPYPGGGPE